MIKRKRKGAKKEGEDLLSVPGMEKLDHLTREVLKVPKEEIEKRERTDSDKKPS